MIKAAEARGNPPPPIVLKRPKLQTGLFIYFRAFFDLTTCRSSGMSIGPIPWTAISEYCRKYDLHPLEDFVKCINALDSVYLEHLRKKN